MYDADYVTDWDGSVIDTKEKLRRLKCKVCNTYTTIKGE